MLNTTDNIISTTAYILSIVDESRRNTHPYDKDIDFIKNTIPVVIIDTVIVGGTTFFSTVIALGYENLLANIKVAFISSFFTAGLSFFMELKKEIYARKKKEDE